MAHMQLNTEALKSLRKTGGHTQRTLAARVGISHISIGYYEQGRAQPRPQTLKRLADELGVSVDALVEAGRAEAS